MNLYMRLLKQARLIMSEIIYCKRRTMMEIDASAGKTYVLDDVRERCRAAAQLGYEVVVIADGHKLRLEYRTARPTELPSVLR